MRARSASVYEIISRLPVPQSYVGKFMAVGLIGTHLPLVALAAYLATVSGAPAGEAGAILLVTLAGSCAGAGFTVVLTRGLLGPVARAARELQEYLNTRRLPEELPDAPARFTDLGACLLRAVRYAMYQLDQLSRAQDAGVQTDPLTGVYNRDAGAQRLREELARSRRGGGEFVLAVVDLDRFEALTGRFGHAFGDVCMQAVAAALTTSLRHGDWVARRNSRQFILGLAGAGERTLLPVIGRVYRALGESPVPTPDGRGRLRLSISVGMAQMEPDDDSGALAARAEHALYRAKCRGRDTAVYHSPEIDVTQSVAA